MRSWSPSMSPDWGTTIPSIQGLTQSRKPVYPPFQELLWKWWRSSPSNSLTNAEIKLLITHMIFITAIVAFVMMRIFELFFLKKKEPRECQIRRPSALDLERISGDLYYSELFKVLEARRRLTEQRRQELQAQRGAQERTQMLLDMHYNRPQTEKST